MAFIPVYILILAFTIIIDYFAGLQIEKLRQRQSPYTRWFLIVSLIANIGVLAVFKYYNFLLENINMVLQGLSLSDPLPVLRIILPIGLSFHTFQAMAYTIEIYRGNQKAEKHFGIYALYVMFYPQLVAGPIERPQNIIHQFYEKKYFDYERFTDGLKLMLWGLFKKVVIADRIAMIVNPVFDHPLGHNGITFTLSAILFAFQIFCDFSGYSDIAIGAAQVMGFKLMKNFDRPHSSTSISEFWKRWHISLSSWFKDYVYVSLGGNRVSIPRWYFNLFIVFVLSGLWHGANWTYIIWGALHGFYLVFALVTYKARERINNFLGLSRNKKIYSFLQRITTFSLVAFALIFFRSKNLHDAFYIISHLGSGLSQTMTDLVSSHHFNFQFIVPRKEVLLAILTIMFMESVHHLQSKGSVRSLINSKPTWIRWGAYYGGILSIYFLGVFENVQFIYFQF